MLTSFGSENDEIRVTSFTNHDLLGIRTEVFKGSNLVDATLGTYQTLLTQDPITSSGTTIDTFNSEQIDAVQYFVASTNDSGELNVPANPKIPFIEGDGIGTDVTSAMIKVVDHAVNLAYNGERKIAWMEVFCGEKSLSVYGDDEWLPDETIDALRTYLVGIKGPLTTPIGGGIRSLNVRLRQVLDLYVCQRPIRYFEGVPSPVAVSYTHLTLPTKA
mgnify:CR=1 FL=1